MSLMERGGNVRSMTLTEKTVREHLTITSPSSISV